MKKFTFFLLCSLLAASCGSSDPWKQADKIVSSMTKVSFPDREVSISDLGAVPGDSLNPCHDIINLAILNMSLQGGGVVKIPAGVFYTGPITLKSNVALELEEGSVLRFSTDESLYYPPVATRWEGLDCYNTHPLLYAWGETKPKENYSWLMYKFGKSSSGPFSKYSTPSSDGPIDNKTVLEPEDDVAHVKLGGKWRMPTDFEWTELRAKCTWTWVTNYNGSGINGSLVKATNGNSIFLPAAGYRNSSDLRGAGSSGCYWSSFLCANYPGVAYVISFSSDHTSSGSDRYLGRSVRPVSEL